MVLFNVGEPVKLIKDIIPIMVNLLPPTGSFVDISAGDLHTCGIKSDGSVECWGSDGGGQSSPPNGSFVLACWFILHLWN